MPISGTVVNQPVTVSGTVAQRPTVGGATVSSPLTISGVVIEGSSFLGSIVGGGTVSSNDLVVNVRSLGAEGDAVCLTDATMASGSAVLTSATAVFTSADIGKLIYVRCGLTLLKTTISSRQSDTQVTLATVAPGNSTIDGGPNVNAIYGTDDAAAFQSMFTALQADALPIADGQSRWRPRSAGFIPSGNYLVGSAMAELTVSGITLSGAGRAATKIFFCESASFLQMDVYDATPADAYGGTASNLRVSNLTISCPLRMATAFEGSRLGAAIQDNGSGNAQLSDVNFEGYEYGFYGAYGSDFTRFGLNTQLSLCDVGAYFGPGSQQVVIEGTDSYRCREGLVFEGCCQWAIHGSSIEDPLIAGIMIEATPAGTTRSGVPVALSGASYVGSMNVTSTWFESDAGGSGRLAPRMIYVNGDAPSGSAGGVAVRSCYLVSGGTQVVGGHNVFMEVNSTDYAVNAIENLRIRGQSRQRHREVCGQLPTCNFQIVRTELPNGSGITYESVVPVADRMSMRTIAATGWARSAFGRSSRKRPRSRSFSMPMVAEPESFSRPDPPPPAQPYLGLPWAEHFSVPLRLRP